eukprot:1548829-Pyramimonas_sp.AAC.1
MAKDVISEWLPRMVFTGQVQPTRGKTAVPEIVETLLKLLKMELKLATATVWREEMKAALDIQKRTLDEQKKKQLKAL